MPKSAVRAATLRRAVEIAGYSALANLLQVDVVKLNAWVDGEEDPPDEAFLIAVDLVTADATPNRSS
jgi:hypothetical protein